MASLAKTMFREYDLRGQVNESELNPATMEIICRAYAAMLSRKNINKVILGYDYRSYSEKLAKAALKGLTESGVEVVYLGMILTPMMYSAQYHFKSEGGVMITASHNPNGWSGVKLALGYSRTLGPEEIKELYELTVSENFVSGKETVRKEDFLETYKKDLLSRVSIKKKLSAQGRWASGPKVVVNTGNGTAGPIVPKILKAAGIEVVELMTELNWNFPRYSPNPAKEKMMEDTGRHVVETNSDLGIAIDADGDRLGVTDEKGNNIWPDRYMIPLSRQVLTEYPASKIIFDVKSTQALSDDIKTHGGIPIMWKTGHSYIKAKLWEEKAPLAGEMSGHIFYGPPLYYGFDDASFAALKLIEFLAQGSKPFSEIMHDIPSYISTPSLQASCPDEEKYKVVEKLTEEFKKDGYEVLEISGARVNFPNGWGLIRASSNLPVLGLRFEAKTQEELEKIEKVFRDKLSKYPQVDIKWESG